MKYFLSVLFFVQFFAYAQQITFPQDTIAYDNLFNNRQFPAYDQTGKIHLTYTGQMGTDASTSEIYYLKEENDGSFTKLNITNNSVSDNYSTLSIDANGKIHVGFTGRDASNLFQIKYTNNVSGTFFPPMQITTGGLNKAVPYSKIGPDSVIHFVYFTYVDGADNAYYRKYDLRTSTLSGEYILAAAESGSDFEASLDVDPQGKVHIVVKSGGVFGGPLYYFTDKSGTMEIVSTTATGNISYPRIAINDGVVHIVYRVESDLRFRYINNEGGTFSTPIAITPTGQRPSGPQNIAFDENKRLFFAYQSSVTASGKGFYVVTGKNGIFSDTLKTYDLTPEYVTRNSSAVIAKGDGNFAVFYAPGAVRNTFVICDIFRKQGNIYSIIPVELTGFTASVSNATVQLSWSTATETNNYGFDIQKMSGEIFMNIGFIPGSGTTSENKYYSFIDNNPDKGKNVYRLKQIDLDGSVTYSESVEVKFDASPESFSLMQNYPNPFNPVTTIKYQLPEKSFVSIKVYDVLGKEVASLFNAEQPEGIHEIEFNASELSSGIYIYTISAGNFRDSKKLMLMK
jgi:hypothetical protein